MIRLAIVLHKSIAEIEALSSRELSEWLAYSQLYGLPDPTQLNALLCSSIYNAMGGKTKPDDFMPKPATDPLTPEDSTKALRAAFSAVSSNPAMEQEGLGLTLPPGLPAPIPPARAIHQAEVTYACRS